MDDDRLRAERETLLLRLLLRLTRAMNDDVINRTQARGHPEVQPSHTRLLGNLDTGGTRIVALARRMGTSRQAASQLLKEIEAIGLVRREDDPDDARGVIVRFTAKGRATLASAVDAMHAIEAEYATALGKSGFAQLKALLGKLAEHADPRGQLGAD